MVHNIHIVSGEINSGKTTAVKELISTFTEKGYRAGGFICKGIMGNHGKIGFFIVDVETGKKMLLAYSALKDEADYLFRLPDVKESISGEPDLSRLRSPELSTGRFFFNQEAIVFGEQLLSNNTDADVLVIDELGILESKGLGFFPIARRLLQQYNGVLVLVIRNSLRSELMQKLDIDPASVTLHYPKLFGESNDFRNDY